MTPDEAIQEATRRIAEGFDPTRIILFGSRARGTADPGSDVDLIVVCDAVENRVELEGRMHGSLRGLPIAVDIIVFTPDEFEHERKLIGSIARPAAREGKVLYERAA